MRIILPKTFVEVESHAVKQGPLFFLAGPVRGGGDWQRRMCSAILHEERNAIVAVPCRWGSDHPLEHRFVKGQDDRFKDQLSWERFYLEKAGTGRRPGCIIFWLGEEDKDAPHPGPEPYAMDTRGELAEWRARIKFENARVVVGAEPGFHGLRTIQRNFKSFLECDFPIYENMKETVRQAIKRGTKAFAVAH